MSPLNDGCHALYVKGVVVDAPGRHDHDHDGRGVHCLGDGAGILLIDLISLNALNTPSIVSLLTCESPAYSSNSTFTLACASTFPQHQLTSSSATIPSLEAASRLARKPPRGTQGRGSSR